MSDQDPRVVDLDTGEQPPHHDASAHTDPNRPPPWAPPEPPGYQPPPERPSSSGPRRSTDLRRLHDKIMQAYASVGLITCAVAQGRGQLAAHATDVQEQAALLDAAGRNAVGMASAAADAWVELATQNPRVKMALERAMEGGAIAGVVVANAIIAIPYGVALGWLPVQFSQGIMQMQAMARAAEQNGDTPA